LFGANEDALIDALYAPLIPRRTDVPHSVLPPGVDKYGHEEIPPAMNSTKKPYLPKEESKQVRFSEKMNLHENSSASSLGDEEVRPIKAQPFLFGDKDDDMNEMCFPTDSHLQNHINI
jgi:hypothetical protein